MRSSRPTPAPRRSWIRSATAAGCAAVLAAPIAACSSVQHLTTGLEVREAVVKLGEQPSASVTASLDGSAAQTYAFLRHTRGAVSRTEAARLARTELTLSVASGDEDTALKDMPTSDAANVAAALNFGGRDIAAIKVVHDRVFLRASLRALVLQLGGSRADAATAAEIVALADDLPTSLGSARDALKGRWVRANPEAFDDFAETAETLTEHAAEKERARDGNAGSGGAGGSARPAAHRTGDDADARTGADTRADADSLADGDTGDGGATDGRADARAEDRADDAPDRHADDRAGGSDQQSRWEQRRERLEQLDRQRKSHDFRAATTVGSALDGQSQREFVGKVEDLLRAHARFTRAGERAGAEHVRMTLPGRESARDLVGALEPLGLHVAPRRVPRGDITADLTLRRGQLSALSLDLGQFTGHGHLPFRLDFRGGSAVPVEAPGGAKELKPQDMLAALLYGALGTDDF